MLGKWSSDQNSYLLSQQTLMLYLIPCDLLAQHAMSLRKLLQYQNTMVAFQSS